MTPEQLHYYRTQVRRETRKEFAQFLLGSSESAVVHWEGGKREIPAWVTERCLRQAQVSLPIEELQQLCAYAQQHGLDFEAMIAQAIRDYLAKPSDTRVLPFPEQQPAEPLARVAEEAVVYHIEPTQAEAVLAQQVREAEAAVRAAKKRPSPPHAAAAGSPPSPP